jgi:GT2 family glycosyltransferase
VNSISVVLPNFNGRHLLEKNLPSLLTALKGFEYEIIVVDDASTDDSANFLQENYPEVILVQHSANKGFSAACNSGIFKASKTLICIANTDVTFLEEYFRRIVPEVKDNVFAAKGRIKNVTPSGVFVNFDTTARSFMKRGLWRFDKTSYEEQLSNFSSALGGRFCLLGCCFVADSQKLKLLGGFDEIYSPFYWEDSDLPFRAMRAGYDLRYVPEAEVIHETSATINRFRSRSRRKLVSDRNKFIFTWRYLHSAGQWTNHIAWQTASLFVRWLRLDWSYYASLAWALARKTGHGDGGKDGH